ncbi:MAG: glycosyltransferase 87 family protein [Promethearchaeota archaeon]
MFRKNWLNNKQLYSEAFNDRYLYPPLFYYLINIFSKWTVFSAPIVMFIFNIATGYLVFHLSKSLGANGRSSIIMMALTLLSPFNLFYSDFIWQNTGVFTTFVVWSMLEISKERFESGMVLIGIAICVKQVALFFLPVLLLSIIYKVGYLPEYKYKTKSKFIEYFTSFKWSTLLYYASIPVIIFFICSIPFIFTIPKTYFMHLLGGFYMKIEDIIKVFDQITPIYNRDGFLGYFPNISLIEGKDVYAANYRASLDVALAWIGYLFNIPTYITIGFSILFHLNIFMFLAVIIINVNFWRIAKKKAYSTDKEYYWLMLYSASLTFFALLVFYDLGIYKYYFVSLTPFWAMFGISGRLRYKNWKKENKFTNLKDQFYGGGSIIHVASQLILQIIMIYFNKWLAPAFLYLPLFLFAFINHWKRCKSEKKWRYSEKFNLNPTTYVDLQSLCAEL